MRRTLTLCRTGVAGVAAFVLLTACGGESSADSASSSSSAETTSSSSAENSAPAADTEFCQQAATIGEGLQSVADVENPAQFGTILQQLADQLHAITPPNEIASDWNGLVGAVDQLAQAASTADFNDPNQAAAFAQTATQLESQLGASSQKVESYLTTQCGIDTSTDSSAPTS